MPCKKSQKNTIVVIDPDGKKVVKTDVTGPPLKQIFRFATAAVQTQESRCFEQCCLVEHNKYRELHFTQPLELKRSLCDYAEQWSRFLAARGILQHRADQTYGENLYMSTGANPCPRAIVKFWYKTMPLYSFSACKYSYNARYFTQLIWKKTKYMGIARTKRGHTTWVVAVYDPPGNTCKGFLENVSVGCFEKGCFEEDNYCPCNEEKEYLAPPACLK